MTVATVVYLGVDPGGAHTGLCVRRGSELLDHTVIDRVRDETYWDRGVGVGPAYIREVIADAEALIFRHKRLSGFTQDVTIVAEAVVAPSPHVSRRDGRSWVNPVGALGAGLVLGAVLGRWPDTIVVPPGQHGSKPLAAYPLQLSSPAEQRLGMNHVGTGRLRHARSAWDIAGVAPWWTAEHKARAELQRLQELGSKADGTDG